MVEWHTWHVQCKRNYGDSGKDKARRRSCVKLAMETIFKEKLSTSIERCEKRSISLEIKRKINDGNGDESYSLSSSHVFNQKGKRVKMC
ncbi:hypothetical protein YC2023_028794 [Brassica napus]